MKRHGAKSGAIHSRGGYKYGTFILLYTITFGLSRLKSDQRMKQKKYSHTRKHPNAEEEPAGTPAPPAQEVILPSRRNTVCLCQHIRMCGCGLSRPQNKKRVLKQRAVGRVQYDHLSLTSFQHKSHPFLFFEYCPHERKINASRTLSHFFLFTKPQKSATIRRKGVIFLELEEKTVSSRLIFDGKVVHLYKDTVRLPNGKESVREYIRHVGAVCILPLTDEGEVLLERQYRYAVGEVLTEIPAGKLDAPDEDPLSAAIRELREETGTTAREMIPLGDYYGSPAILGERIRMYLAKGLCFGETEFDDDEFLEVFRLPLEEAEAAVLRGEIPDGKTQAAILRAAAMRRAGSI